MHFNEVDIPDELIQASLSDNLVIFAGAGVSKQPPVGFPGFDDLVKSIKTASSEGRYLRERLCTEEMNSDNKTYAEPPEKYLGYLENEGCDIRTACANILNSDDLTTELHKGLVSLFSQSSSIRIVTTNFDKCFESALQDADNDYEGYIAPALPLGDDFQGLVHLHGSIDRPSTMVLTSRDYGRAYVTEGWASRFLVKLFSKHHVLFIGYSCEDSLVDYLTRSISDEIADKAYVLLKDNQNQREWVDRGVKVISFNDYDDLPKIINGWATHIDQSLTDRVLKIRQIAESDSIDGEKGEFFLGSLSHSASSSDQITLAEAFCSLSRSFDHLEYLANNQSIIFFEKENPEDYEYTMLRWAVSRFAILEPASLQELCFSIRERLSWRFYFELCATLAFSDVSDEVIGSWIAWIEHSGLPSDRLDTYSLLEIAEKTDSPEIVLAISRTLLKVDYDLKSGLLSGREPRARIPIKDSYEKDLLIEALKPYIDEIGDRLVEYCIRQIEIGYLIRTGYGTRKRTFDGISYSRLSVASHEQDEFDDSAEGTLLDVARECMREDNYSRVKDICLKSRCGLIVRLGLWIQEKQDEKGESLDLVMSEKYLDDVFMKHEVYELVLTAFKNAPKNAKDNFADYLRNRRDKSDRNSSYECFNICVWITRSVDDFSLKELMDEVLDDYPDFVPREHPDLSHYTISGLVDSDDECDIEENEFTAEFLIERIGYLDASSFLTPNDLVGHPARKYPTRAIELLGELGVKKRTDDEHQLCNLILQNIGWENVEANQESLFNIMQTYLKDPSTCISALDSLASRSRTLCNGRDWTASQLKGILRAFKPNIPQLRAEKSAIIPGEETDWVLVAINHPIESYVDLCVRYLCVLMDEHQEYEDAVKTFLEPLCDLAPGSEQTAYCTTTSLAMRFDFLIKHTPRIVEVALLPALFAREEKSRAAWDGIAILRRISKDVWDAIGSKWRGLFRQGEFVTPRNRDLLCRLYVAHSMAYVSPDEISDYILACACSSVEACRASFHRIDYELKNLDPDEQMNVWDSWLAEVTEKIVGRGSDFQAVVVEMYARWLRKHPQLRSAVIGKISSLTNNKPNKDIFVHSGTISNIALDDCLTMNEKAIATSFLLNHQKYFHSADEAREAAGQLEVSQLSPDVRRELEDAYTRKGMSGIFR